MKKFLKKLHIPAVFALVGQLVGITDLVASNPQVAATNLPHLGLSPEWAAALVAVCTAIQALTRAINTGDKMEVQKPPAPHR